MAKLNEFVAKVRSSGLANVNRYTVAFSAPGVVSGSSNTSSIMLYCSSVNVPGINFASNPSYIFGEQFEFAYQKTYSELTMTFYVDKNLEVKKLFDKWSEQIYNTETREFGYYDDYTTDITITVQDKNDNNIYIVNVRQAFPKSINDIQMSYADNQLMTLQVVFSYKNFIIEEGYGKNPESKLSTGFLDEYINNFTDFQKGLKDKVFSNAKAAMNSVISKFKP